MNLTVKREREWEASALRCDNSAPTADEDSKRPRLASPLSSLSSDTAFAPQCPITMASPRLPTHPLALLDTIRTKLQRTSDPHLQARLLLQYSSVAACPNAKTSDAIDFLFSFLQQNQTHATTSTDGNQTTKPPNTNTNTGAIIVRAIVRGLRQLLAIKPVVVETMIQVDAMGEQLMQCMSVSEDFKLRREMMQIVLNCLVLASKYSQVETLLYTCIHDHDTGMQLLVLRGYLRLYDVGWSFPTTESAPKSDISDALATYFDQFTAFLLFAASEKVQTLAAHVLVTLANLHSHQDVARSHYVPSSTMQLPEKCFQVLCMAGNDPSKWVRAQVARCLRQFSRRVASDVVEHAVIKTPIEEAVDDVTPDVVARQTRHMMSSGVLLSLLEDAHDDVAAEASRTIAYLNNQATAAGHGSLRALERSITAHLDVLPRVSDPSLSRVLIYSLYRLFLSRYRLDPAPFTLSSAEWTSLLRCATLSGDDVKATATQVLKVLQYCDLASVGAVQRLMHFVLDVARLPAFANEDEEDERLLGTLAEIGNKCVPVLQLDVHLSDQLQQEAAVHGSRTHKFVRRTCRAFLGRPTLGAKQKPATDTSGLFFLRPETSDAVLHDRKASTHVKNALETLRLAPADHNLAAYVQALQLIRTATTSEDLDVSFTIAATLVQLRQFVQTFPTASPAPVSITNTYVSMEAMLSTSPCVSSGHMNHRTGTTPETHDEAHAFARFHLSIELQQGCQEIVNAASSVYMKAFALTVVPRLELLQLLLLGRIGLVLASLPPSSNSLLVIENLRYLANEAHQLRFVTSHDVKQANIWLPLQELTVISSLNDLKRLFVATVRKAWPTALLEGAISRWTSKSILAIAHALILTPCTTKSKLEPREITANWPFDQPLRFLLTNVRDVTQVYVKSELPNGHVTYHRVPSTCVRKKGPRKHVVKHTIRLIIAPFSDPTRHVTVCLGHPILPGSIKPSDKATTQLFTDISAPVSVSIFHRTNSTLRQTVRSSPAP